MSDLGGVSYSGDSLYEALRGLARSDLRDVEAVVAGMFLDAVGAQAELAVHDPESPGTEWLDGFGAGRRRGMVDALAAALGAITGQSPRQLVEDAVAGREVDHSFPFDLVIEDA